MLRKKRVNYDNGEGEWWEGGWDFEYTCTNLASVRLVPTRIHFPARQPRVRLLRNAVHALCIVVRVLFLHVNFKRLLVLVVPVTLRTFERLTRITRMH